MRVRAKLAPCILLATALVSLSACAHHALDCQLGIPMADCLPGTAGYTGPMAIAPGRHTAQDDADALRELDRLYDEKRITDEEYQTQKAVILRRM
jgi:hypothetical protein